MPKHKPGRKPYGFWSKPETLTVLKAVASGSRTPTDGAKALKVTEQDLSWRVAWLKKGKKSKGKKTTTTAVTPAKAVRAASAKLKTRDGKRPSTDEMIDIGTTLIAQLIGTKARQREFEEVSRRIGEALQRDEADASKRLRELAEVVAK